MLNYVRQFSKIESESFPHTLCLKRRRWPPIFLAFLTQVTHYLTTVKILHVLKKYIDWNIFARTSLSEGLRFVIRAGPQSTKRRPINFQSVDIKNWAFKRGSSFCSSSQPYLKNEDPLILRQLVSEEKLGPGLTVSGFIGLWKNNNLFVFRSFNWDLDHITTVSNLARNPALTLGQ